MADGSTTNYHFILPEPGAASSTWGVSLNTNLVSIDGYIKANTDGVAAVNAHFGPTFMSIGRQGGVAPSIQIGNFDAAAGHQTRWVIAEDAAPESGGSNRINSNLVMSCYDDNGASPINVFSVTRATGRISVPLTPANPTDVANKTYVDAQDAATLASVSTNYGVLPVGAIIMWPSGTSGSTTYPIPTGWVQCFGQHYKVTDMPALFAALGGFWFYDGTNFGVPNLAGRVPVGWDGNATGAGYYVGLLGGAATVALAIGNMPAHDHGYSQTAHGHTATETAHHHQYVGPGGGGAWYYAGAGTGVQALSTTYPTSDVAATVTITPQVANITFGAQGSGVAIENRQPFAVVTFLIRYI